MLDLNVCLFDLILITLMIHYLVFFLMFNAVLEITIKFEMFILFETLV